MHPPLKLIGRSGTRSIGTGAAPPKASLSSAAWESHGPFGKKVFELPNEP
jgi:hypothetical protein